MDTAAFLPEAPISFSLGIYRQDGMKLEYVFEIIFGVCVVKKEKRHNGCHGASHGRKDYR
jgi:hypothetical protein